MGKIDREQQAYLKMEFGERVSFRKTERKLYGHDIAAMPGLVKPLLGDTTPEAVVQPGTEAELVKLVRWAAENNIALTPRGKATSGYGGVLPIKKGVVVDFHRMNRIVKIDTQNQTATVQAGVMWERLDAELAKHGLALRLYPSSYPSSTVGGWLAQGGAGVGSYEMGWFASNVKSARAVLADGTAREFSGLELNLLANAEGITGLISEVTIAVKPLADLDVLAVACPQAGDLQGLVQALIDEKLPIWSLLFTNPRMAELRNKTPLMERYGHPAEERVSLPSAYIVTLAFRRADGQAVRDRLPDLLKAYRGEMLTDAIARHEWENRFKIMMVKRLGPSLVPVEVVVPLPLSVT